MWHPYQIVWAFHMWRVNRAMVIIPGRANIMFSQSILYVKSTSDAPHGWAQTGPNRGYRGYQTLPRIRKARPIPRKRLKVAALALAASEWWRFLLQARIASVSLPAAFKHSIPAEEEAQASLVQFTVLSPAPSNRQCHPLFMSRNTVW